MNLKKVYSIVFRIGFVLTSMILVPAFGICKGSSSIDSIKAVLAKPIEEDSIRFELLSELAIAFESINIDSALYYYNQSFNLAKSHKWFKEMGHVSINRSFAYHYELHSDTSITLIKRAVFYYKKSDYVKGQVNAYYTLGTFWSNFEQFDSAIYYLQEARQLGELLNDTFYLNRIYNNLGLMYQYVGLYDLSIEYTIKAIELKEKIKSGDVEKSYLNLGLSYGSNGLHEHSLHYYRLAQKIIIQKQDTPTLALITKNIGNAKRAQQDFDSAQYYYDEAYNLYQILDDSNSMSRVYLSLSGMAIEQREYRKALNYGESALLIFPQQNSNIRLQIGIYIGLAKAQSQLAENGNQKYWKDVLTNAEKALSLATSTGLKVYEQDALELLFKSEKAIGNYIQAVAYAQAYNEVSDSLRITERIKSLTEQQVRFDTEKKEIQLQSLNRENKLKTQSLEKSEEIRSKQQLIIWILTIGLMLVLGLVLLVVNLYKKRTNNAKILQQQNELIHAQKEEKEILLKEIHHRVKNNLQVVIALLELQDNALKDNQFSEAVTMSQNRIRSMAMIHELLYKNSDVGNLDFKKYISKLLEQVLSSYANNRLFTYSIKIQENIHFDLDTAIPLGLIVTELFTNAVKYAVGINGKTEVELSFTEKNGAYTLEMKDNGQGLPEGFDLKNSKSLGMRLIHSLSKQVGGEVSYQFCEGAVFSIKFTPYTNDN